MRLGKMEDTIKVKYYTDTWLNGFGRLFGVQVHPKP